MKRAAEFVTVCFYAFFIMLISNSGAKAQIIWYSPASATINQSMRSAALGGATVAMEGYPGAALINPATIGIDHTIQAQSYFFDQKGAVFKRVYWRPGGSGPLSFTSPSLDFRYNKWAVSASFTYYDLNALMDEYQTNPSVNVNYFQSFFQLAGAYEISSSLRLGFGFKNFRSGSPGFNIAGSIQKQVTGKATALDFGAYYHKAHKIGGIHNKISIGGSLLNFGTNFDYNNGVSNPLPLSLNIGAGLKVESQQQWHDRALFGIGLYGAFTHNLARADDNGHPYGAFKALFKGWAPYSYYNGQTQYTVSTWDQIGRCFGLEMSVFEILDVRLGSNYESQKIMPGSGTTKSWGVGIDLFYFVLDYTEIQHDSRRSLLGTRHAWQGTIRIPLESSPRNFWPEVLKRIGIF